MKILVPIKRVVDYNVKVRPLGDQSDVDLNNVKMAMNPFCEIAVEEAVRLKEAGTATEVVAVTVGKSDSQEQLRTALALGADFVMFGRPLMYAIGADGARGLRRIINLIKEELSTNLGLVGLTDINEVDKKIIAEKFFKDIKY